MAYDRTPWLRSIAKCAVLAERWFGTPATKCIAHAAVESAWGRDSIGNNHFGMKKVERHAMSRDVITHEWLTPAEAEVQQKRGKKLVKAEPPGPPPSSGEEYYRLVDTFADYPSMQDSVNDWAWLLSQNPLYFRSWQAFQGSKDPDAWVVGYMKIYATANKALLVNQISRQQNVVQAVVQARKELEA